MEAIFRLGIQRVASFCQGGPARPPTPEPRLLPSRDGGEVASRSFRGDRPAPHHRRGARAEEALAFPNAYGLTVRYAMKACPNGAVLKLFDSMGLNFDASSAHEVRRAMRAGVPASKCSLSTQQLDADAITLMRDEGLEINCCSLSQLDTIGTALPGAKVGMRFNPGLGSGGTAKTNVGGASSSFGIWHEQFDEVVALAKKHDLEVVRVHTHIGSGSDAEVWKRVSSMSLDLCERLGDSVKTLNLGSRSGSGWIRTDGVAFAG